MTTAKRAIISGSTDGIGRATAINLCRDGYAVTLISRNIAKLIKLKEELNCIRADEHTIVEADLEQYEDVKEILADHKLPPSEKLILVNNVGGPMPKDIMDCDVKDFQAVFNKYFLSYHQLTQHFVPAMKRNKWGRIINILGTIILSPIPGMGLSSIKSATSNWSKSLSMELGVFNITVNDVLPGPTRTKELTNVIKGLAKRENMSPDDYLDQVVRKMSLRRIGEPEEIAEGVAFLSSDKARFITGSRLTMDGGYTTCL